MNIKQVTTAIFLSLIALPASAALSPTEKQLSELAAQSVAQRLPLLEKIVNINSASNHPAGVKKVGAFIEPALQQLGFNTRWSSVPAYMNRAGSLIAERQGKTGKRILLIGHLDTVFAKSSPFNRYQLSSANKATGPGIGDDKGGVIVILAMLDALNAVHALDDATIRVVLTGDEESSGKPTAISRAPLIELAKTSDVSLDFEPAVNLETATIARRGITEWQISASGVESHSSTIFNEEIGYGAIFEMARILNTMRTRYAGQYGLTFNPGLILGGTRVAYDAQTWQGTVTGKENIISNTVLAIGEFRYLTAQQKEEFKAGMQQIIDEHLTQTKSEVTFQDGIPAMSPTTGNTQLLEQYSQVSEALGTGKVSAYPATLRGAADIAYVSAIVPANLSGLGPIGLNGHAVGESIILSSLTTQTQRAALLIYQLIHAKT